MANGKTEASAFSLVSAAAGLDEGLEKLTDFRRLNTAAGIDDSERGASRLPADHQADAARIGEFHRVAEQVE